MKPNINLIKNTSSSWLLIRSSVSRIAFRFHAVKKINYSNFLCGLWIVMMDPCFIPCNNSEKKFSGFALSAFKFSSLNFWQHAFCSGVNVRGTELWHHQDWMDDTGNCATWDAQLMSYNTDLNATILQNHVLHFLAHFLWRWFHWLTWTWIFLNRFPTQLKLLGPKLYLVVGRWNIIIYSIHPFMDFFQLLPFLCEEFYHGTKFQIPHVRLARHCTCHPPSVSTHVRLICECGCYKSRHVPSCTFKATLDVAM